MGMPIIRPSGISRCQAITDIVESVALEQAAISHLLNAEGEKLQAVIASEPQCADKLLEANASARAMVETLVRMENALHEKLALFAGCLCDECRKRGKEDEACPE